MNNYILSLLDLLVGFISVLTDIAWRTTVGFFAGNFVCKLIKFLQVYFIDAFLQTHFKI